MCTTKEQLQAYLQAQREEILGPVNMYYAGLALGHKPTPEEATWHYIFHGGPIDFRQRWQAQRASA